MAATAPGNPSRRRITRDAWPVASSAAETVARVPAELGAETEAMFRQRWRENRDRGGLGVMWRALRRMIFRRVHRLNAPVVYPWFDSAGAKGVEHELHRAAARIVRSRVQGFWARSWHYGKVLTWPVVAALGVLVSMVHYGRGVRTRFGVGLRTQLRDLVRGAFRHGIFPTEFYHHRVFCEPARSHLAHFFGEREMIELMRAAARGENGARVEETLRFFSECRAGGFSVPHTAAFFRQGELEFRTTDGPALLPEKDLVVRVLDDRGDCQGERWHWNPLSRQWSGRGVFCGARALFEEFRCASRHSPLLVQVALNNHPEMARFSAGGLVEVRIATWREENGDVMPLSATMRMPSSAAEGPPGNTTFLASSVALPTGVLSRAVGEFISDGEFDVHPETGAVITGTVLPRWHEMLDLARRAHRQFDGISYLCWRVSLSGNGLVILGAGHEWDMFSAVPPATTGWAEDCLRRLESGVIPSAPRVAEASHIWPRPA